MVCLELPNGTYIDFETIEGLFSALDQFQPRSYLTHRATPKATRSRVILVASIQPQ